jgi:hypothetical protein
MSGMTDLLVMTAYDQVKRQLEDAARDLRALAPRDPRGRPTVHLADACADALRQHPEWWPIYQAGIRAGLPPEFQQARRRPRSPKAEAWQTIEVLARTLVVASIEPLTLHNAVARVVEAMPSLFEAYQRSSRTAG